MRCNTAYVGSASYRRFGIGYRSHLQGSILGLLEPSRMGR